MLRKVSLEVAILGPRDKVILVEHKDLGLCRLTEASLVHGDFNCKLESHDTYRKQILKPSDPVWLLILEERRRPVIIDPAIIQAIFNQVGYTTDEPLVLKPIEGDPHGG